MDVILLFIEYTKNIYNFLCPKVKPTLTSTYTHADTHTHTHIHTNNEKQMVTLDNSYTFVFI